MLAALLNLLANPSEVAKSVQPSLSTLEKTVIGATWLVTLAVAILAVIALIRVQNSRVKDQKDMSERMEKLADKSTSTTAKFTATLDRLIEANKDGEETVRNLQRSVDGVVMEAVRRSGYRSYSPSGVQVQKPPGGSGQGSGGG